MSSSIRFLALIAILFSAIGSVVFYGVFDYVDLAAVGLSLVPILIITYTIQRFNDSDIFSPLYMVLYLLVLSVFIKTLYLTYSDSGYSRLISLDGRGLEILIPGTGIVILGVLMFAIGYAAVLGKQKTIRVVSFRSRVRAIDGLPVYRSQSYTMLLIIGALVAAFCSAYIIYRFNIISEYQRGLITAKRVAADTVGSAGKGSSLGYFRMGAVTLPQVLVLITMGLVFAINRRGSFFSTFFVVILFLLSLIVPILTSARLEMLYLFIMMIMVANYYRKKMSIKHIVPLAVFLILIAAVLGQARYSQRSGQALQFASVDLLDRTIGSAYFMDIAKTSVVVDAVPEEVDYMYGKSFILFLIAPIPRSMWLEKPSVRISTFVGDEIYNRPDNSGVPPGFIAESYLNFGIVGVTVCLLLLGALCAKVYHRFILRPKSLTDGFLYVVLIMVLTFTLLSGDLTVAISQAGRYGLLILLISRIFGKFRSSKKI